MDNQVALQNAIRSRLQTLQIRFPRYSIRAFSKKAGVSAATLSLILKGKRKVSPKLAKMISEKLLFDPQERAAVMGPFIKPKPIKSETTEYVRLTQDQYLLIADWRAFALLNLMRLQSFKNDTAWIAKRLGISISEAEATKETLLRLGMIAEIEGVVTRKQSKYRTTDDVTNLSLQKSHAQTLELAQVSLENDPVESRDFSWVTFAMNKKTIPQAKTLVRKFQDDLLALVAQEPEHDEVYRLAVQMFPLTKLNKK